MNWMNVATVYAKELKDTLRDRRAVMSMIVIPTLVMPVLIFGLGRIGAKVASKAFEEVPVIMIIDGKDSPSVTDALKASRKVHVVPTTDDWKEQISDKKIRAAILVPPGFEAALQSETFGSVTVYTYQGELKSSLAANELDRFFRDLRDKTVISRLAQRSLPASLVRPFEIKRENVAAPEKVGGNLLGGFLPYIVIILSLVGAMYPAMDLTAGEKERGTLETLLCTPVGRTEIVIGKFCMVLTGSIAAVVLSLVSMGTSLVLLSSSLRGGNSVATGGMQDLAGLLPTVDPRGIVGVVIMTLPVAVMFSAIVFTISLFAKSYKEAQTYITPMIFIVIMPAAIGMMPGMELNARLALVPVLGLSLICKEMLSGVWHWQYLGIIFVSSSVYAAGALALAVRMFKREDVIFRS
jgi:sodium transport system permease protein